MMAKIVGGNGQDGCSEEAAPVPVFIYDDGQPDPRLRPPPAPPGWVERRGLIDRLDRAAASRLILVAAPAGYGKTTLLARWCTRPDADRSFAWVSLDENDNVSAAVWRLVVGALERALRTEGLKSLGQSFRSQPSAVGRLLPDLIKELGALERPVTIVLDGYDAITDRECHNQLRLLLRDLPPQAQVALGVRSRPPLALARMRTRGEVTEIGPRELSMTSREAAQLMHGLCGAELSLAELERFIQRTEGWPAGVYLAGLSLCAAPDPHAFMSHFTGNSLYVTDYLTEEVISRQPERIQQFLLQTSVLDRFNGSLCAAVTGSADANGILGTLENENVFLVPLDDHREWFRYHHLFADVLLHMLMQADPGAIAALRLRASDWHRQHGRPGTAVSYALAAGDAAAATVVIAESWYRYMDSGLIAIVRNWLAHLGTDRIRASPLAAHCAVWAAALSGDRLTFTRWLPVVEASKMEGPLPDGMRSFQFSAALARGTFGYGGIGPMAESAAEAVELDSDPQSEWRPLAMAAYGTALYLSGELAAAQQWLDQALLRPSSLAWMRVLAWSFRSLVAVEEGRPGQAAEFAQAARETEAGRHYALGYDPPGGALTGMAMGAVYASEGRLEEAKEELSRALAVRRRHPGLSPWPKFEIVVRLGPVLADLGDRQTAAALLAEARDMLSFFPDGAQAQVDRLKRLEDRLGGDQTAATEHLTQREQAVLRWLEGALSLSEISKEMYVSTNTVKTHTRAIYRKLGVSSRQDAIERGRVLGLL